jgi:predicted alpha/beta superfamily hydrolase
MIFRRLVSACFLAAVTAAAAPMGSHAQQPTGVVQNVGPLTIGETFILKSRVLGEERRINVYPPPGYSDSDTMHVPVMYMPDGGMKEDFLHVAGLIEVLVGDNSMRPFLLVGIENTERRRDLTGPTSVHSDSLIAPHVGGSDAFRTFIRTELMPAIRARYRTTAETGIVGESLAGLFVTETFLGEPDMFDTYVAIDPSLWWNNAQLLKDAPSILARRITTPKKLYVAASSEPQIASDAAKFNEMLKARPHDRLTWFYESMPAEGHQTIYHPAALRAFRMMLKPDGAEPTK